ncbi:hypothetical protein ACHQM5_027745 [Ranunculus cassubicifolius]
MKKCTFSRKRDRISYLPDKIQSRIVSFLPMKDAIRTSILSRQWKHVSTSLSISNLEFDSHSFKKENFKDVEFRDLVDEMLFHHNGSDVHRFILKAKVDDLFLPPHHVCAYISYAVDHNVQEIELVTNEPTGRKRRKMLPPHFFTCKTLTILSLSGVEIECPSSVSFPALKSLTFLEVRFFESETINKLVLSSTCPVLEDLCISECDLPGTVFISNPTLRVLKIRDINDLSIEMSITGLREFECLVLRPLSFSFENLSSLSSATFGFHEDFDYPLLNLDLEFRAATKLVKCLANVEKLTLETGIMEILSTGENLPGCLPPPCFNVKHLHLGMSAVKVHVQVIKLLLRIYPNVQTLKISVDNPLADISAFSKTGDMEETWQLKEMSHENVFNCLGTVEFLNFRGNEYDLDLLKFVVENAKFLKNLIISCLSPSTMLEKAGYQMETQPAELLSWLAKDFPSLLITVS